MSTTPDQIAALENQRWVAQIAGDTATLAPMLAEELSYTHSNGVVDTKASYVTAIDEKIFDYQSEARTDVVTHIIGDMAMVTGRVAIEVISRGRAVSLDSRYSVIWVERDGGWQFLCWQSTPIAS